MTDVDDKFTYEIPGWKLRELMDAPEKARAAEQNSIVAIIDDLAEKHPLCRETCKIILRRIDPALIPDDSRVDDRSRTWLRWWNR